ARPEPDAEAHLRRRRAGPLQRRPDQRRDRGPKRPDQHPDDLHADRTGPKIFVAFYDGCRDTGLFGADLCANLGIRAFFFPIDHWS
ncbi:MAG TPA: hypothetical protein VEQ66_14710, partial [Propionibacteriaceae bacterium]|nr:hypothetical protein [Propionibacteriaceae bacterium]